MRRKRRKWWIPGLAALLVAGVALYVLLPREEARAGGSSEEVKKLVAYVKGDAAWNLKLQALEKLVNQASDSAVEDELEALAKGGDEKLAIYSTSALGRRGGSTARTKLKSLLTDGKAAKTVRLTALSVIVYQWKDSDDLSWLESETKGDSDLAAQFSWLKKNAYGK